jgi:hypothetical protein
MCGRYALYTDIYEWSQFAIPWPFEDGFSWTASYNVTGHRSIPVGTRPWLVKGPCCRESND